MDQIKSGGYVNFELPSFTYPDQWAPNAEGIWLGMPEHHYRAAPGLSQSQLKPLFESAKKFKHALENPKKATAAMHFGTIVHALTLGQDKISDIAVIRPVEFDSFRTKAAKQWRDSQTLIILSDSDLELMTAASKSIKADSNAAWILAMAKKEVAVFRRHERTGMLLKARLDLPFMDQEDKMAVADIKKTQTVNKHLFSKEIGTRLYHLQAAWYSWIIGASSFYFICVEEAEPNEVAIYKLSKDSIIKGGELYEKLLTRLVECRSSNSWPSRFEESTKIEEISIPIWLERETE